MSVRKVVLLAFLLASASFLGLARAQDTEVAEEEDFKVFDDSKESKEASSTEEDTYDDTYEEEDLPMFSPSSEVTTHVFFPDFKERQFPLDEEITALIVFSNSGSKTFNISHCVSSLHSSYDLSYYVQNFTSRLLAVIVEPQRQITVEFKFKPDKNLEANEFWLSGYIVYNDTATDRVYVNSFVNGTISLYEQPAAALLNSFFNVILLVVVVGGIFFAVKKFFWKSSGGKAGKAAKSKAKTSASTSSGEKPAGPSGYESAVYKQAQSSKAVKRNKKDKKDGKKSKSDSVAKPSGNSSE